MRRHSNAVRLGLVALLAVVGVSACGGDDESSDPTQASGDLTSTACEVEEATPITGPALPEGKPEVSIPDSIPTELVITDLIEGVGEPAGNGDVIEVNYVGVLSADGTEFDNSFKRNATYPVTLGRGGVIAGWDEGLIGIKPGGRRQLDIPAELAYGDRGSGEIIKPGDALTFIVDAVSIKQTEDIPTADPADKPQLDLPTSNGATEVKITDLVLGEGCTAGEGSTVHVQIITLRGDTLEELDSTWETGEPIPLPLSQVTVPGLVKGVLGMAVGGRRAVIIPPAEGFGDDGNQSMGLPPATDLIVVLDLVSIQ